MRFATYPGVNKIFAGCTVNGTPMKWTPWTGHGHTADYLCRVVEGATKDTQVRGKKHLHEYTGIIVLD